MPLKYKGTGVDDLIAEMRRETNRHLPYRRIAKDAGVAPSTVSRLERGITRHPRFSTMVLIANAIGCEYILQRRER